MKPIVVMATALLVGSLWQTPAGAWTSANRYGGSTSHSEGETSHTNAYGGSSSHAYGEGSEHTNTYGGSSEHAAGGGSEHTNAYGGSTSGAYGQGATHTNTYGGSTSGAYGEGASHTYASGGTVYHPPGSEAYGGYPAYHAPVAVPSYSANGCNGCAATAGAIAGATAGVAVGVAAASAAARPTSYAALPAGCVYRPLPHAYDCGGMWLAPSMAPTACPTVSLPDRDAVCCGDRDWQPSGPPHEGPGGRGPRRSFVRIPAWCPGGDAQSLSPPDTSSPRATLQGFTETVDGIYTGMKGLLDEYAKSGRLYLTSDEHQKQMGLLRRSPMAVRFLDISGISPRYT